MKIFINGFIKLLIQLLSQDFRKSPIVMHTGDFQISNCHAYLNFYINFEGKPCGITTISIERVGPWNFMGIVCFLDYLYHNVIKQLAEMNLSLLKE